MPGTAKLLLVLFCCIVNPLASSEKNDSTFVPSREWQPVKKGQPIPSGLHIRHNLQTGMTEAKLLDKESEGNAEDASNSQGKSLTLHPDKSVRSSNENGATIDSEQVDDNLKISLDELKARLKKIKLMDNEMRATGIDDEASEAEAQERFKSYTNLKNEFKALEVNITTDAEMLTTFFQRFENYKDSVSAGSLASPAAEEVLHILNNMEYLLHQIDNAQTFADMGGMSKIVSPCFNATNDDIKAEALRLLGTAVQSNPKVQAKALEHDFVQKLLHILAVNTKVTVQSRCMFALSALIRQYPAAQKALVDHGGLEIFGTILEDGHLQTQSRVMRLMSDLVVERTDHGEVEDELLRRRKIKEYASTDFDDRLLRQNYCRHLSNLMISSFSNEAFADSNMEDYDFLTVILESMITLGKICKRDFRSERYSLLSVVREASRHYESVRDGTSSDDDHSFTHLVELLGKLKTSISEDSHDEL